MTTGCFNRREISYEAVGNDVADIKLVLAADQTFKMDFYSFEEESDSTEENKKYIFTGRWAEKGENFRLDFHQDKKEPLDLNALFDKSLDKSKAVTIESDNSVSIKKEVDEIHIWGIVCRKK